MPSLKLIGAKTEIRDKLYRVFPQHDHYFECFAGTGGVLIGKPQTETEVIGDLNSYVINYYEVLQEQPEEFFKLMKALHKNRMVPEKEEYFQHLKLEIAKSDLHAIDKAVYFYLITKHCFNGIFRFNKDGECNSAWGGTVDGRGIFTQKWFDAICKRIELVQFCYWDYSLTLEAAGAYDPEKTFVFLDPPYSRCKTTYNGIEWKDEHFEQMLGHLKELECKWLLTINDNEFIRGLFEGYYTIPHQVHYQCSQTVEGRGKQPELLISNYDFLEVINSRTSLKLNFAYV